MLDYDTNTWTVLPPMIIDRADHTCIRWEMDGVDGILVLGGVHIHPLTNVEFFDLTNNKWKTLTGIDSLNRLNLA